MKVKGSQGRRRVEWLKVEHPWTASSDQAEMHANHNETHNSARRRRCSAYHRRQNLYAKTVEGLQRAVSVQRLTHNWVRVPDSLATQTTLFYGHRLGTMPSENGGIADPPDSSSYPLLTDQCQIV